MDWVTLSLVSALAQVSRNAAMKSIGHLLDEYINVFGRFFFLLPFAGAMVLYRGVPEIRPSFYTACAIFGVTQTIATLALSKGLLYGNISMVTSLWKLSIVWLVVLSHFTIGETPSALGLMGIMVTLVGVYFLNVSQARVSFWEPVRTLYSDRGMRYALLSSLMFAPSAICFKWAALSSNGAFGTLGTYLAATLCVLPVALRKSGRHFARIPGLWKPFVALGLFAAINSLAQAEAYQLTLTSYVESVKQTEILFAIGVGYFLFRERERLSEVTFGGIVILSGIVLLILAG